MPQTFSDDKFIYSVDMMMAYLMDFKHPVTKIKVSEWIHSLEQSAWGDPEKKISYSPFDVIQNPSKYPKEFERVQKADLKFPVIIANGFIVDGQHRLTKAYINNESFLKAYIFDKKLLKNFVIAKQAPGIWDQVHNFPLYKLLHLYYHRFCTSASK